MPRPGFSEAVERPLTRAGLGLSIPRVGWHGMSWTFYCNLVLEEICHPVSGGEQRRTCFANRAVMKGAAWDPLPDQAVPSPSLSPQVSFYSCSGPSSHATDQSRRDL